MGTNPVEKVLRGKSALCAGKISSFIRPGAIALKKTAQGNRESKGIQRRGEVSGRGLPSEQFR